MERFRIELGSAVDALARSGRATVTESKTELALYQLDGLGARAIVGLLEPAGFRLHRLADEGGALPIEAIDENSDGIELVATKPIVPNGVFPVLSAIGFASILERAPEEPIVWLQGLERAVHTVTVAYLPWGDGATFVPEVAPPDPSRVVRLLGAPMTIEPIGRWLLRDADADVSGRSLSGWRARASEVLAKAITQEIEGEGPLLFRGPPPTRFRNTGAANVEVASLAALQRAVGWVYENPRELENRHGLLAAEVARTALKDGDLADLASIMRSALEGARIAYGFGVSQQSRDALRTLSDLRKAVADETGKLADVTRSLAAAVMTSAVGNIGLVIARLTIAKDSSFVTLAAVVIGIALAIYVAVVIGSGSHFLAIQRDLRRDWRERLYRFLGNDEYERMVSNPVGRAERGFRYAAIASGVVAALMLAAVVIVALHAPSG